MKKIYLKVIVIGFVLLLSCSKDDSDTTDLTMAEEIHVLVNGHRESKGLQPLKINPTAQQLAKEHTEYMINANVMSHDKFDERSAYLQDNENAIFVGENVASGQSTAQDVVSTWLKSPGHRKNIEEDFVFTGISAKKDASGKYYFTQLFFR